MKTEYEYNGTQGEWATYEHSWSDTSIEDSSGTRIALLSIGEDATEEDQGEWEERMSADANLISASPRLLANLLAQYEYETTPHHEHAKLQEIIDERYWLVKDLIDCKCISRWQSLLK